MKNSQHWAWIVASLSCMGGAALTGCSDSGSGAGSGEAAGRQGPQEGSGENPSIPVEPPKPVKGSDACIISADCPAGTHCDLGECVQACNSEQACDKGLACSVRARCITPDEHDEDPAPVTEHVGTVKAEVESLELGERDAEFEIKLESDTNALVGYRVEVRAPFLALDGDERGEFAGSARLKFAVDPSAVSGTVASGVVIIHTTLGDVTVNPSIRVGLTGRYQGVMRYSAGKTPLGDVGVALDMLDKGGNVRVRVDPQRSMTFPEAAGGAVTGRGQFTFTDGLALTLTQALEADFGGERNHFKRPLGRRVSFSLKPASSGKLEGTFEEKIYGITEQPLSLNGTAYFEPTKEPEPADFTVAAAPLMPVAQTNAFPDVAATFPGWSRSDCFSDCAYSYDRLGCIRNTIEPTYYEHLVDSLAGSRAGSDPLEDLAKACATELAATGTSAYKSLGHLRCASIPPLACALDHMAQSVWTTSQLPEGRAAFNRVTARMLAPALFLAQDSIKTGLKRSFLEGASAQNESFAEASVALQGPTTYAFSSGLLGYLKALPVEAAKGDENSDDPTQTNYPAARALSRLVYVLQTLDGEESRAAATDVGWGSRSELSSLASQALDTSQVFRRSCALRRSWQPSTLVGGARRGAQPIENRSIGRARSVRGPHP